ncbi:MAG TPA: hypothetical protein VMS37_35360 [Verrucomicrobiae bacterium]|nr:hypothetical protein [Verrucomicrobiae bacterium]
MAAAGSTEDFASVRAQLECACRHLTLASPVALDQASEALNSAARQLAELQSRLPEQAGNPAALEEAWRVRRAFLRTRTLLYSAAAFHGNWTRVRGAMSGGYTRTGEPGPVLHASRLCLQA